MPPQPKGPAAPRQPFPPLPRKAGPLRGPDQLGAGEGEEKGDAKEERRERKGLGGGWETHEQTLGPPAQHTPTSGGAPKEAAPTLPRAPAGPAQEGGTHAATAHSIPPPP